MGNRNSRTALNEIQMKTLMQRRLVLKARLSNDVIHWQAPDILIESCENQIA